MDEASRCDRIALIQEGKMLSINTPDQISAAYPYRLFAIRTGNMSKMLSTLGGLDQIRSSYAFGGHAHVSFQNNSISLKEATHYLSSHLTGDIEITETIPTIEDCFIQFVKN
jgi:ABC-type multidrug transport system ATPase subunit